MLRGGRKRRKEEGIKVEEERRKLQKKGSLLGLPKTPKKRLREG